MRQVRMDRIIKIETEQEADGRWLAEAVDMPGVLAYGDSPEDAVRAAQVLAFRVLADRIENDEERKPFYKLSFAITYAIALSRSRFCPKNPASATAASTRVIGASGEACRFVPSG